LDVIECGSAGFIENICNHCHTTAEIYLKFISNFKSWYQPECEYWILQDGGGIRQILQFEKRISRDNLGDDILCENVAFFFLQNICKAAAHIRRNENIGPKDSSVTKIIFDRLHQTV
jgi:hypothetical protein